MFFTEESLSPKTRKLIAFLAAALRNSSDAKIASVEERLDGGVTEDGLSFDDLIEAAELHLAQVHTRDAFRRRGE